MNKTFEFLFIIYKIKHIIKMNSDQRSQEFRRENQRDDIMNRMSNEGRGSYGEAPNNDLGGI